MHPIAALHRRRRRLPCTIALPLHRLQLALQRLDLPPRTVQRDVGLLKPLPLRLAQVQLHLGRPGLDLGRIQLLLHRRQLFSHGCLALLQLPSDVWHKRFGWALRSAGASCAPAPPHPPCRRRRLVCRDNDSLSQRGHPRHFRQPPRPQRLNRRARGIFCRARARLRHAHGLRRPRRLARQPRRLRRHALMLCLQRRALPPPLLFEARRPVGLAPQPRQVRQHAVCFRRPPRRLRVRQRRLSARRRRARLRRRLCLARLRRAAPRLATRCDCPVFPRLRLAVVNRGSVQ
jgi:hypothetical protein